MAVQALGFDTINSCEGHIGRGAPYPSIDANAPIPPDAEDGPEDEHSLMQQQWKMANLRLVARLDPLLEAFNATAGVHAPVGHIPRGTLGAIRLQPTPPHGIQPSDLVKYQADMAAFSTYVLNRVEPNLAQ